MNDTVKRSIASTDGSISVSFIGIHRDRPPKATLFFDVTMTNATAEPRWFFLPDKFTTPPRAFPGVVEAVDVYRLEGQGSAVVGHVKGTNGFHALCLPMDASVTLRRFPVSIWSPPPDTIFFNTVTARGLMINGEPGENWFEVNHVSDQKADVHADVLAEQKRVIAGRSISDNREVPVTIHDSTLTSLEIHLAPVPV
ncbi:MAG: hypothetical protein M0Z56_04855 [Desulfobacteraceae bacterium]|nr:hypothetical protein [Desulfobacteraceae bacterium]